jgi:hypothetical protein
MWGVWGLMWAAGCGGAPKNQAQRECEGLAEDACSHVAECLVEEEELESSDRSMYRERCEEQLRGVWLCKHAKGVSDSYTQCYDDLPKIPCDALLTATAQDTSSFPASCRGVILQ